KGAGEWPGQQLLAGWSSIKVVLVGEWAYNQIYAGKCNELNIRNLAHQKINGIGNDRTFNAIKAIDNFFKIA
ncbi:MAG: hypothetical protein V1783_08255, partial [Bacteroidota bacterium]